MKITKTFIFPLVIIILLAMINIALAAQTGSSDVGSITDIGQWHHPVKDVLQKQGIVVLKIELLKKKPILCFIYNFPGN